MTVKACRISFLGLVAVSLSASAYAATVTAANCSQPAVAAAVAAASDGDTVVVPAGTCDWTVKLMINKAIALQGQGIGSTIITTGVPSGQALMTWNLVANRTSRMTGIEFRTGTVTSNFVGAIQVNGVNTDNRRMRVDHCKANELSQPFLDIDTALGVADHNTIIGKTSGVEVFVGFVKGSFWNGTQGVQTWGDGAYVSGDQFGTDQFWFFEDNTITNNYAASPLTAVDSTNGGRYVFRYNTMQGGSLEAHGLEAERGHSGRARETYNNTFTGNNARQSPSYVRGGVDVIHDNTIIGWTANATFSLLNNRSTEQEAAPFYGMDGRNPWDVNDARNPFTSGTASSAGTLTVTDSTKSWTTNQWAGYQVRRTSGKSCSSLATTGSTITAICNGHGFSTGDAISFWGADQYFYNGIFVITVIDPNTLTMTTDLAPVSPATGTIRAAKGNNFSEIVSNTATQLTFKDSVFGAPRRLVLAANDTFEVNKVTHAMDQIGRIGGSNLAGVNLPTLPSGWNNQTTSASYAWNNTREGGAPVNFSSVNAVIVSGTHFYNDTQKPGYTPYTYPHPLITGQGIITPPTAPTGIHIR